MNEAALTGVVARHGEALGDGGVRCLVCPRHCTLREGQRGFCFVRACRNGQLVSTTYGRSSGFCVDPIEKKPLNHFLPGTPVLSFGTAGCNLSCRFCQNWHLSRSREVERAAERAPPDAIARAAARLDCRSVAFTYNDPVVFLEYAVDTARACHVLGVRTVAVTAGYMEAGARRDFYQPMDAANVDLKAFSDRFYRELCGATLQPVLDTLLYLKKETAVWVEITTLLIPGENDSEEELDALTRWVSRELGPDVPLHFTAFYPAWHMSDRGPTSPDTLRRARTLARRNGLHHVYLGNVRDPEGATTYCAACGKTLVGREGYQLTEWNLQEGGRCRFCGEVCAGVWDKQPGRWGPRCVPVQIGDLET